MQLYGALQKQPYAHLKNILTHSIGLGISQSGGVQNDRFIFTQQLDKASQHVSLQSEEHDLT